MSWLKNMLFEEQPEFEKKKNTPPPVPGAPVLPTTPTVLMAPSMPQMSTVHMASVGTDPTIKAQLVDLTKKAIDPKYAQFKTMSDSMKTILTDNKQRFTAAYLAVKATGTTKNDLVNGAGAMLQALLKEKAGFQTEINNAVRQIDANLAKKEKDVGTELETKKSHIAQLQNEIAQLTNSYGTEVGQMNAQKAEIERQTASFLSTSAELEKEIQTEISDLTTYVTE